MKDKVRRADTGFDYPDQAKWSVIEPEARKSWEKVSGQR